MAAATARRTSDACIFAPLSPLCASRSRKRATCHFTEPFSSSRSVGTAMSKGALHAVTCTRVAHSRPMPRPTAASFVGHSSARPEHCAHCSRTPHPPSFRTTTRRPFRSWPGLNSAGGAQPGSDSSEPSSPRPIASSAVRPRTGPFESEDGVTGCDPPQFLVRGRGAGAVEEDPHFGLPPFEVGAQDRRLLLVEELHRLERLGAPAEEKLALSRGTQVSDPLRLAPPRPRGSGRRRG